MSILELAMDHGRDCVDSVERVSRCKRCGRQFKVRKEGQEYGPKCARKLAGHPVMMLHCQARESQADNIFEACGTCNACDTIGERTVAVIV